MDSLLKSIIWGILVLILGYIVMLKIYQVETKCWFTVDPVACHHGINPQCWYTTNPSACQELMDYYPNVPLTVLLKNN